MSINFDFGDLEAFLAVKETASFHAAAERLHLSQSAITRRIRKLEEALDTVLFERTTRAVRPTLAAKRLQARAEAILEGAEETARAMRDESVAHAHQRGALVTLATIPTVIPGLVLPALAEARREGFAARVRLLDASANHVAEAVAQGEADFGISSIPLLEPNARFEPLFDDEIVGAMAVGHTLAGRDALSWGDLSDQTLVLPARGTGNRLLIDEALARLRLPIRWTYEVGRSTTALEFAAGGMAIALLPRSAVAGVGADRIAWRSFREDPVARPVGLLSRVGQSDSRAVTALKRAIRAQGAAPPG